MLLAHALGKSEIWLERQTIKNEITRVQLNNYNITIIKKKRKENNSGVPD